MLDESFVMKSVFLSAIYPIRAICYHCSSRFLCLARLFLIVDYCFLCVLIIGYFKLILMVYLVGRFSSRLLAWFLSRTMGASVGFRVAGCNCLRDVAVKFKKVFCCTRHPNLWFKQHYISCYCVSSLFTCFRVWPF